MGAQSQIFKNQTTDAVFVRLKESGLDGFELLLPQYATTTNKDIQEVKEIKMMYLPRLISFLDSSLEVLGLSCRT